MYILKAVILALHSPYWLELLRNCSSNKCCFILMAIMILLLSFILSYHLNVNCFTIKNNTLTDSNSSVESTTLTFVEYIGIFAFGFFFAAIIILCCALLCQSLRFIFQLFKQEYCTDQDSTTGLISDSSDSPDI